MSICPACGIELADTGGPVHAYLTHSAECWGLFNRSMELHYSDAAYWPAHQLLTDAYCLQHSIGDDRRARRSAGLHLAALVYQIDMADGQAQDAVKLRQALARRESFPAFDPFPQARHTIADVDVEHGPQAHMESVRAFARGVHADWAAYHETARHLIGDALGAR